MVKLEDVLKDLDSRIRSIEIQLQQMRENGSINSTPKSETRKEPSIFSERSSSPTSVPSKSIDSSSVLAFIGVIFIILAGVFFVKTSIDSGWLTPMRQVFLSAGVGLIFFFIPLLAPKAEQEYGAILAGTGTTILHLTWLGAYFYHHVLSLNSALGCATAVGIFSIFSNYGKGNRIYLIVAMAGTYLAAPFLSNNLNELSVLTTFILIWNISFSIASFFRKSRDITFIASYFAVLSVLILSGNASSPQQYYDLLILNIIQFIVFLCAMVSYSFHLKETLSAEESLATLPLLLLFYFVSGRLLSHVTPQFAPWFGIATGIIVLGVYFIAKSHFSENIKSGPILTSFATLALMHSIYFQLIDESLQPLGALIISIPAALFWLKNASLRHNYKWPLLIVLSTFVYGAFTTVFNTAPLPYVYLYNWAYGGLALLAVLLFNFNKDEAKFSSIGKTPLLLGFSHIEIMLGLYRVSYETSFSGSVFVTTTWGFYALLILGIAYWKRNTIIGSSALIILIAVSLKAFFFDLVDTDNIFRIVSLLIEGLLLYCCGWIFKKMRNWEQV